jgi:5'-methylthioadenosine phosphorylase
LLQNGALKGERLGGRETPFGESAPVFRVDAAGREVIFLSRHGESGYTCAAPWVNYRANIYALKDLDATAVIAWSGPGAIDASYSVGQFVVPHDIVDETRNRPSSFFVGGGLGFLRMDKPFCPTLRNVLASVLDELGSEHACEGVYVCTEGPRLETPAEIRKYGSYGGQLVGMTLAPEAFLARELEMCYAALCYITNYAEGVREREHVARELFGGLSSKEEAERVERAVRTLPQIIELAAQRFGSEPHVCSCRSAMERYRKEGRISGDWRSWITV